MSHGKKRRSVNTTPVVKAVAVGVAVVVASNSQINTLRVTNKIPYNLLEEFVFKSTLGAWRAKWRERCKYAFGVAPFLQMSSLAWGEVVLMCRSRREMPL